MTAFPRTASLSSQDHRVWPPPAGSPGSLGQSPSCSTIPYMSVSPCICMGLSISLSLSSLCLCLSFPSLPLLHLSHQSFSPICPPLLHPSPPCFLDSWPESVLVFVTVYPFLSSLSVSVPLSCLVSILITFLPPTHVFFSPLLAFSSSGQHGLSSVHI